MIAYRLSVPALAAEAAGLSPAADRADRAAGHAVLPATVPAEWRGGDRDEVRLLVSDDAGHHHARFIDLPNLLEPGDLLVVNESATLPASLPARVMLRAGWPGAGAAAVTDAVNGVAEVHFRLNLSTRFSARLWLAEPRWSVQRPGPMPLRIGDRIIAGGISARLLAPLDGAPRLWFIMFGADVAGAMQRHGEPIRYGYVRRPSPPLSMYQTIFARRPGSAEMPSAARPFTPRVLERLRKRGVTITRIVLHTSVSGLDASDGSTKNLAIPEPFQVTRAAAEAVNRARRRGRRVIAVGTTVVRALESAATPRGEVRATSGLTRLMVEPARGVGTVDGLITGLHEPHTSHRALLEAVGGAERVHDAHEEAIREGYLWHEFGDVHLLWSTGAAPSARYARKL